MIETIRYAFNRTLDLYQKGEAKKLMNFSVPFVIVSFIFAAVLGGTLSWIMISISGERYMSLFNDGSFMGTLWSAVYATYAYGFFESILALNFSLFAVVMLTKINAEVHEKTGFFLSMKSISGKTWASYLIFLTLIIFANGILFEPIFSAPESYSYDNFSLPYKTDALVNWANSMMELLKKMLPYFFTMLILLEFLKGKITRKAVASNSSSFFASTILSFSITAVSGAAYAIITTYLTLLTQIPFINNAIPFAINMVLALGLISYLYPAFAGFIMFPFMHKNENDENH